jgi:hypothetical protein
VSLSCIGVPVKAIDDDRGKVSWSDQPPSGTQPYAARFIPAGIEQDSIGGLDTSDDAVRSRHLNLYPNILANVSFFAERLYSSIITTITYHVS